MRTTRRSFLTGVFVCVAPLTVNAHAGRTVTIGWLSVTSRDRGPEQQRPHVERYLRQSGWDPQFELRYASGDLNRLAHMADDLARAQPHVIIAPDTQGAIAAKRATGTIPIVMSAADPIGAGLVTSLARPGANVTGVSVAFDDGIGGKWVELLREVGTATSLAVVWNSTTRSAAARINVIEQAAVSLGLRVQRFDIQSREDADSTVQTLARTRIGGLVFDADLTLIPYGAQVAEAARRHRIPSVFGFAPQVEIVGGLLAYGPSLPDVYRRISVYVDKVLRGARPGDLPVEQVQKYDLVINLKTAKALGLTLPPSLLLRADQVIE